MRFVRHYLMIAKAGEETALASALEALAAKVRPIEGCTGVELYQDIEQAERFTFLERWDSVDAHKAGGKLLGKEAFGPIMAALASPPQGASIAPLLVG